jgi:hypothetical protein
MQGHIDVVAVPVTDPRSIGSLGPMAGAWDGYADLSPEVAMRAKALVGHIHAQAENCARAAIDIGLRLITLKELLPHGQFGPCVKDEFGWSQRWAQQLIQVAERFANTNSSSHLPSSAKVLAMLAASGADDATVQQAADQRWTVAETKRRIRNTSSPRQPQPAEAMALNMIRKGDVDRIRQALALADRAETVTAEQVMAEQRLRELPKAKVIHGLAADFHRLADGQWVRLPHAGEIDVQASVITAPAAPPPQQQFELAKEGAVLTVKAAAAQIGMRPQALSQALTPASQANRNGPLVRKGYLITREGRGLVQLLPVASQCGASDGTT